MATNSANALFDFADQLALVSADLLRYRIKNKAVLNDTESSSLEDAEIKLDKATAKVRAQGIEQLGMLTNSARKDVLAATDEAAALLRRIKRFERALDIVVSVTGLALAAIAGQPLGIVAALKVVIDTVEK